MTHLNNIANKFCFKFPRTTMIYIRKAIIPFFFLSSVAIMSGCQSSSEESEVDLQDSQSGLDDVVWVLESFDSIAGPQSVIKNTHISLSIDMENMQLHGVGGCNNYSADFVLDEISNNITISNVINTEIWCDEPENIIQQEQDYFATLAKIQFFTIDKATLNMVVGSDAGLNFVAAQPGLENVVLILETFDSIAGPQPVIEGTHISLSVDMDNMQLHGMGGCNNYSADFVLAEMSNNMTISNVIADEVWCDEPENVMQQEQDYFATLAQIRFFTVNKATLNMAVGGDAGLHFVAEQPALDDVVWTLESFDSIAGPQPVIEGTHISLSVDMDNMQLHGMGGCNNYSADFVLAEMSNNITISNVINTEMWCDEPENVMQQEQEYFATLAQIRFFTVDKATLNMAVGGDAGLHFVVAD